MKQFTEEAIEAAWRVWVTDPDEAPEELQRHWRYQAATMAEALFRSLAEQYGKTAAWGWRFEFLGLSAEAKGFAEQHGAAIAAAADQKSEAQE